MAGFVFEIGTQADATAFTAADMLVFNSDVPTDLTVTPGTGNFGAAYVALSDGTQNLLFGDGQVTSENMVFLKAGAGELQFGNADDNDLTSAKDGDSAYYGFGGDDAFHLANVGNSIVHGGDGDDTITIDAGGSGAFSLFGDAGNDTIDASLAGETTDPTMFGSVLSGGAGDDTITGTDGNDHIYGSSADAVQGSADGADELHGGAGHDYIQGNGGDDLITGDAGDDRLRGGAGDDEIHGGDGNDTINGNMGDDTITGDAGNDSIHGGQGNDSITGDAGDDILLGDLGNDDLTGGVGHDVLTGGDGNDVFHFAAGDSSFDVLNHGTGGALTYGSGDATSTATDQITDFTDGQDHIDLGFAVTSVLHADAGTTFGNMAAAQNFAQTLLAGASDGATDVAALTVGSDTYLFFNGAGGATDIDSAVQLLHTDAASLTSADFTVVV